MSLFGNLLHLAVTLAALNASYEKLAAALEKSGQTLTATFAAAADTPHNRQQARHIIGIERWGQRRLRVALGEPPVRDEYNGYKPAEAPMRDLSAAFASTRAETRALVKQLQAQVPPTQTALHNDMGEVTMLKWLVYLERHAALEGLGVK